MNSWLDNDRDLMMNLRETDRVPDQVSLIEANISEGEALVVAESDPVLAIDVMLRLAASYLLLSERTNEPQVACEQAATWAIRAGRLSTRSARDVVHVIPRAATLIAITLAHLDPDIRRQAVDQIEYFGRQHTEATSELHRSALDATLDLEIASILLRGCSEVARERQPELLAMVGRRADSALRSFTILEETSLAKESKHIRSEAAARLSELWG